MRHRRGHRAYLLFAVVFTAVVFSTTAGAADTAAGHDHAAHAAATSVAGTTASPSFFGDLLKTYTPRRVCMDGEQPVIWLHLISDALIAIAYFTIPLSLLTFVRRRKDLAFNWMFVCFAVFILACGLTHVMNIVAIWAPVYRTDGLVKAVTAVASVGTAVLLWRLIPAALLLPSPAQLRESNALLGQEVIERKAAEERLTQAHAELEQRVRERTVELSEANASERAARGEAERALRIKDEFLATLSHELRTPLNAILGWTQVIQQTSPLDTDVAQGLDVIERNAKSQAQIIEDLLDMSRIVSGKVRLDVQRVSLESILRSVLVTMTPAADAKAIRTEADFDPAAGLVSGDAGRLQQVFWNLLTNAIKFTPSGGHVRVALRRTETNVEVRVSDTGEGIREDFLPFVFDRFRQADATTTRRHGGLGLGLSIVKTLVELHGGTVAVRSDGEGRGSTFTVRLPLTAARSTADAAGDATPQAGVVAPAPAGPSQASIDGVRVLVVDDEPDARSLVKRLLEDCGAVVFTAGSAAEARQLLTDERPNVLVSDIGMPGEDGYTLIRHVRGLAPGSGGATPAVALTAYARAEDRAKSFREGFQMHLTKPVDAAELIATVAGLAGHAAS